MGMSIWENNGNGNKCLAGMGIQGMGMEKGLKRMGMKWEGMGKLSTGDVVLCIC